ncbi:hypothetical protein WR25_13247 [Diploscapter pachys]|uniref:F-box domain-containing protein n=1 Tax=Diploscapter pachys TaxID=2018661 RepID=A0A2A2KX48_9BILA|nr:hypothetical protein WR25_13247 [Diploscapter pachys]
MILDGLPLELMREVLLDLPTVDIIQTVKCTRRLHHFAKTDKALSRRLQNRVFNVRLRLDNYVCKCRKSVLCLYLSAGLRREIDVLTRNGGNFYFWFEDKCKCHRRTLKIEPGLLNHPPFLYESHLREFENGTSFAIKNGSRDDAVINCGKFFNILMKFCVIQEFQLDLHHSDDHKWDKMSAFFNANPPDLRIQPYVFINSRANLDNLSVFPNGLAGIQIFNHYGPILTDTYNEVFRRTPHVSISEMDPPYTYEDLVGLFKDTKRLSLRCVTNIAEEQLCQLVQHFYEVKHDEECLFEIGFAGGSLITDLLTLIPEEAYSLHLEPRFSLIKDIPKFPSNQSTEMLPANHHQRSDRAVPVLADLSFCQHLRVDDVNQLADFGQGFAESREFGMVKQTIDVYRQEKRSLCFEASKYTRHSLHLPIVNQQS